MSSISRGKPPAVRLDRGFLAGFANDAVDVALGFGDRLFDPRGMNAPVRDEAAEREAADFAAHRVEAGDGDDIGRVVDDQVAAERGFEGADVATLASDDAALHLVGRDLHDGDGGFGRDLGGDALNGGSDDLAGAFFGLVLGLLLGFADKSTGLVGDLAFDLLEDDRAGFVAGQA